MECRQVIFSRHAVERLFQREISPEAISDLLQSGEVIARYPDDKPYPSVLLLGFAQHRPVHAVVARDPHRAHVIGHRLLSGPSAVGARLQNQE